MNGYHAGANNDYNKNDERESIYHPPHHEINGFHAEVNNGFSRNLERETTRSTLSTSNSSSPGGIVGAYVGARISGGGGGSKKMVKIKLWDPGESSSAELTVVTVAMEMPTSNNRELVDGNAMHDLSLGVGQRIQLSQHRTTRGERNNYSTNGGEENAVDISWQPLPRQRDEVWQPPLRISQEDRRIARGYEATREADDGHNRTDYQTNRPQSPPAERYRTGREDHATREEGAARDNRNYKTIRPPSTSAERQIIVSEDQSTREDDSARNISDYQKNRPQPTAVERQSLATPIESRSSEASIPTTIENRSFATSNPKTETSVEESESLPTRVKGLEPFTIPSIFSSTVIKRTPDEKVGLAFRKLTGTVVIEKIVPGSPFDGTALRPGFECLSINGRRLRSARRAAEIVKESGSSLVLVASNAPRPPGTMYTMISLKDHHHSSGASSVSLRRDSVVGMYFEMKHGLVQMVKMDRDSPIGSTSMKVGDFVLALNGTVVGSISKAVEVLSESNDNDMVPILYFNMRQLRVSLVDKVIGDSWKKEWSDGYDECIVLQPTGNNGSSNPLTLRFKEEGMCELLDPLNKISDNQAFMPSVVPANHPLNSVVETLNHGIICVLSAIREGVELATATKGVSSPSNSSSSDVPSDSTGNVKSTGSLIGELTKLSEMYKEGLLSKEDFEAIKSKLLKT